MKKEVLLTLIYIFGYSYGITFGNYARIKDFPYLVSVQYNEQHICGGVILNNHTILTAARCVNSKNHNLFSIRAGSTYHDEGEEISVANIIQHPYYNQHVTHNYDIAMLKLATVLQTTDNIRSVKLKPKEIPIGTKCKIVGWGVTEDEIISSVLKASEVIVIYEEVCEQYYEISPQMMCTSTTKEPQRKAKVKEILYGDFGGPLVCTVGNKQILGGIISFAAEESYVKSPVMCTKIFTMYNWIQKYI